MTEPSDTKRAEEAQTAIHAGLERVHELVCEARFMLRPHDTPGSRAAGSGAPIALSWIKEGRDRAA